MSRRQNDPEPNEPAAVEPEVPAVTATPPAREEASIEQLRHLLGTLTDDQRMQLQRAGVAIPEGDIDALFSGDHEWGLRCTKCNHLALTFVGRKFRHHGFDYEQPPPVHHSMVPWFQDLQPGEIDRHAPKCQNCRSPVPLTRSGGFNYGRQRLVRLEEFGASRDRRATQRQAKQLLKDVSAKVSAEAGGDDLSASYTLRDRPVSTTIADQHGAGILAQIDATMEHAGVTQALARGFRS